MPNPRGRPRKAANPDAPVKVVAPPHYVTVPEAAALGGVSETTIRAAIRDGTLTVIRVGKLIRIDPTTLAASLAARAARLPRGPARTPGSPYHDWRAKHSRKRRAEIAAEAEAAAARASILENTPRALKLEVDRGGPVEITFCGDDAHLWIDVSAAFGETNTIQIPRRIVDTIIGWLTCYGRAAQKEPL